MQEKRFIYQFIPPQLEYLTSTDKIKYKGINLKTDYLISMMNDFFNKYYSHKDDCIDKENRFNIWSVIFREKYGTKYNYYVDYLRDKGLIVLISDYYRNKKARTYMINPEFLINIKRCKIDDNILMKKTSKEFLTKTLVENNNSTIPLDIRYKLVNYLYEIELDVDSSINYLNYLKDTDQIEIRKYFSNLMSIENIGINNIYFKFDNYGRFHSNFTVLKKHIRQNYIKIDGMLTKEVDIKNSQPLFLSVLMKQEMTLTKFIEKDVTQYIELVENGLIYEYIMEINNINDREKVKEMMYIVMFGTNGDYRKENNMFRMMFPTVYDFIKDYKQVNDDYKSLSHRLQLLESDFIYNKVVKHIINTYPEMKFFTIHDSIIFPEKYYNGVLQIFNYYKRKILE